MTKTGILFVGFLLASTSLLTIGCDGEEGTTGGAGGSGSTSSSSSSGEGGASSSSSSSSSSGGDPVAIMKYCTDIMANCKDAATMQYPSMESCMNAAAGFPAGMAADTAGDTLGCRQYHAGAAMADAATHCPHAGPAGGGTTFCGETCDGFCDIAVVTCKTEWPDKAACMTACKAFPTAVMNYNTSITSGDTVECRLYHLSVAATDAASATTHCPHTMAMSSQCM